MLQKATFNIFLLATTFYYKCLAAQNVDVGTILGKNMVGYQGWFTCEDGKAKKHWFENDHVQFEMLPDVSEYPEEDLCTLPGHTDKNNDPIKVFTSESQGVVDIHLKWMQEYNIDGPFLQQFLDGLDESDKMERKLKVTEYVKNAAEKYGRAWAIMFDCSNYEGSVKEGIKNALNSGFKDLINQSPAYLHQNNKPLVAVWGIGRDSLTDPKKALEVVQYLKEEGYSVFAGVVGSDWTEGDSDWETLVESFDVISPWMVGTDKSPEEAGEKVKKEIDLLKGKDVIYTPVIFPGFSWTNLKKGEDKTFNDIPRKGGDFMKKNAEAALNGGAQSMYIAMFDEVNEATSIFKTIPSKDSNPKEGKFLALDEDGENLKSDHYLTVAGEITALVRESDSNSDKSTKKLDDDGPKDTDSKDEVDNSADDDDDDDSKDDESGGKQKRDKKSDEEDKSNDDHKNDKNSDDDGSKEKDKKRDPKLRKRLNAS